MYDDTVQGPKGEEDVATEQVAHVHHNTNNPVFRLKMTFGRKAPHAPVGVQAGVPGRQYTPGRPDPSARMSSVWCSQEIKSVLVWRANVFGPHLDIHLGFRRP